MKYPIYFLVRAWNAYSYFDRCISSILQQKNKGYTILYIWDGPALAESQEKHIRSKLRSHIIQINNVRKYAVRNAYEAIHTYVQNDDAIIVSLDGDDWLIRDDAVDIIIRTYVRSGCEVTYGNCRIYNPGTIEHGRIVTSLYPDTNTRYPLQTDIDHGYGEMPFRPLHLKTWKASVYKQIPRADFLFKDGSWLRFCEDQAIMFPLLMHAKGKYAVIGTPLSAYNQYNDSADRKLYFLEKIADEVSIRRKYIQGMHSTIPVIMDAKIPGQAVRVAYTPLLRRFLTGEVLYLVQFLGLLLMNYRRVYISCQQRWLEYATIAWIRKHSTCIICESTRIGKCLRTLRMSTLLLLPPNAGIRVRTEQEYEDVMWTLTFSHGIGTRSLKMLQSAGVPMNRITDSARTNNS